MEQALRQIGRDDIVRQMNKQDLDCSEGDSLRLADASNLNLNRSNFSSKGSLQGVNPIPLSNSNQPEKSRYYKGI